MPPRYAPKHRKVFPQRTQDFQAQIKMHWTHSTFHKLRRAVRRQSAFHLPYTQTSLTLNGFAKYRVNASMAAKAHLRLLKTTEHPGAPDAQGISHLMAQHRLWICAARRQSQKKHLSFSQPLP